MKTSEFTNELKKESALSPSRSFHEPMNIKLIVIAVTAMKVNTKAKTLPESQIQAASTCNPFPATQTHVYELLPNCAECLPISAFLLIKTRGLNKFWQTIKYLSDRTSGVARAKI